MKCQILFSGKNKKNISLFGRLKILSRALRVKLPVYVIYMVDFENILASTSENVPLDICAQERFRSACAFAQPDLNFHWASFG